MGGTFYARQVWSVCADKVGSMKQTSFTKFSQAPPAVDTHIQASIRPGLINWRPSPFVIRVLTPFSFVLERIWH